MVVVVLVISLGAGRIQIITKNCKTNVAIMSRDC